MVHFIDSVSPASPQVVRGMIQFCRAIRRGENGRPSLRARPRTEAWRRFKAAEARTTDALWATRVLSRSSSSGVHGLDIGGISVAEDHHANRKDGGADPDKNGGLLLRDDWRRWFHDQINRNLIIGFRRVEPGPAFFNAASRLYRPRS
jgi:hypothetical protein